MGIRNLSPHLCNSAILQTTKSIAELQTKKSCGTAIADVQNLTSAIPQLSAVSRSCMRFFTSDFFFHGSTGFHGKKFDLCNSATLRSLPQLHEIFYLRFFFHGSTVFHSQKYAENCENEAFKLRTSEKIVIAELQSFSCGATFL